MVLMAAEECIFPCSQNREKHIIYKGKTKVTWNYCNKRLLAKKLPASFASTITVKIDMDNVTLTLFADVLNEYFSKKDVRPKRKKLLFPEMRVTISGNLHLGGSKFFFF